MMDFGAYSFFSNCFANLCVIKHSVLVQSQLHWLVVSYRTKVKILIYIKSYLNLYNVAYLTFCLLIVQHALLAPPLPNCNLFSTPDRKIGDPSVAVFEFLYVDNFYFYFFKLCMWSPLNHHMWYTVELKCIMLRSRRWWSQPMTDGEKHNGKLALCAFFVLLVCLEWLFPDGTAWLIKVWRYFSAFVIPSIVTRSPTSVAEMQI